MDVIDKMNLKENNFEVAVNDLDENISILARLSVLDTEFIRYQYADETESRKAKIIYDYTDEGPYIVTDRGDKVFLRSFVKYA